MSRDAPQCSTVQCSAVQCSAVGCSSNCGLLQVRPDLEASWSTLQQIQENPKISQAPEISQQIFQIYCHRLHCRPKRADFTDKTAEKISISKLENVTQVLDSGSIGSCNWKPTEIWRSEESCWEKAEILRKCPDFRMLWGHQQTRRISPSMIAEILGQLRVSFRSDLLCNTAPDSSPAGPAVWNAQITVHSVSYIVRSAQ